MGVYEDRSRSVFHQYVDADESRNTSRGLGFNRQVRTWRQEKLEGKSLGNHAWGTRIEIIFSDDTQLLC